MHTCRCLWQIPRGRCTSADASGESPEVNAHVQRLLANPQRLMYTCRGFWQIPRGRCTRAEASGKSPEVNAHVQRLLANPQRSMYTCRGFWQIPRGRCARAKASGKSPVGTHVQRAIRIYLKRYLKEEVVAHKFTVHFHEIQRFAQLLYQ